MVFCRDCRGGYTVIVAKEREDNIHPNSRLPCPGCNSSNTFFFGIRPDAPPMEVR
jgi:hypothetical protein